MDYFEECRIIYEDLRQAVRDPRTYNTHMRQFVELLDKTKMCDDLVDFREVRMDTYHALNGSRRPGSSLLVQKNYLKEQISTAFSTPNNLWFHATFPFRCFGAWYRGNTDPYAADEFVDWWKKQDLHQTESCYSCERAGDW